MSITENQNIYNLHLYIVCTKHLYIYTYGDTKYTVCKYI